MSVLLALISLSGVLCLTGCNVDDSTASVPQDKELTVSEINSVWKMDEEDVLKTYGFSADWVEDRSVDETGGTVYVTCSVKDIEIEEIPCSMILYFTGYGKTPYLEHIRFCFQSAEDGKKLLSLMQETEDYRDYGESSVGFFDHTVLSEKEIDWLNEYTPYFVGEQGLIGKEMRYDREKGRNVWTGELIESPVLPLVSLYDYTDKLIVDLYSSVYNFLPQQKAVQQHLK